MKQLPFENVISDVTSKFTKVKKSDYLIDGTYPIIDQSKEHIAGYTNERSAVQKKFCPIIVFGDHTRIFKYETNPIALGADGAKALWVNPEVAHDKYVYYFLKSIIINEAGYSRHFKFLKERKIPIPFEGENPNLQYQIRIATLLDRVEALIATRINSLQQMDDFLKSTFLEMFGDPVWNERGWEKEPLGGLMNSRLGKMRDKQFITGNHLRPYIGNSNVQWFEIDTDNLLEMDFNEKEREIFKLEYGDLLVCEGGDIGRCAIWKNQRTDCYFQKALHRVRVGERLKAEYLQYVLKFYSERNGFRNVTSKSTIAHLTGVKLKETLVPLPPLDSQEIFTNICIKIESLKIRYKCNLKELQNLYSALSQKAFKGELDLSRIPLTEEERARASIDDIEKLSPEESELTVIKELSDPAQQKRRLMQWLSDYQTETKPSHFSLEDFWEFAETKASDFQTEEEDSQSLGLADYELIKGWIFGQVQSGELKQYLGDYETLGKDGKRRLTKHIMLKLTN